MKVKSTLIPGGFFLHVLTGNDSGERLISLSINGSEASEDMERSSYAPFVMAQGCRELAKAFKKLAKKLEAEEAEETGNGSPV